MTTPSSCACSSVMLLLGVQMDQKAIYGWSRRRRSRAPGRPRQSRTTRLNSAAPYAPSASNGT